MCGSYSGLSFINFHLRKHMENSSHFDILTERSRGWDWKRIQNNAHLPSSYRKEMLSFLPQNLKTKVTHPLGGSEGFFLIPWDHSEVCHANLATTLLGAQKSLKVWRKLGRGKKKDILGGPDKIWNEATVVRKEKEFKRLRGKRLHDKTLCFYKGDFGSCLPWTSPLSKNPARYTYKT